MTAGNLGFRLVGEEQIEFADRVLQANHWVIDPQTELSPASAEKRSSEGLR